MLHQVVRSSDFITDLKSDACERWRKEIALPKWTWRHCWHCLKGEEELGFGRLIRKGTPYATGFLLERRDPKRAAAAAAAKAKLVCTKSASQEHSWTWTFSRAERAESLRRIPKLVLRDLSDLEIKAELAEAWAGAFEARWGEARAVAAGVRDAVLRARANVDRIARVRDQMELIAREERVCLKVS